MSRSKSLWFGLSLVVGMLATGARAQEEAAAAAGDEKPWSIDAALDYNSKYVWRGILVTDDPVLQPSITFAFKGFSLNIWANMDLTDVNDNDGEVKGSDFLALKGSWYKCYGDDGYDPCADFDRDGCVKGSDFLILKNKPVSVDIAHNRHATASHRLC